MGLKIKWNDDRVRGATTAILLIGRDRLARGDTADLVSASLAEYRDDPERYKRNRAAWADPRGPGPLTDPAQVASYQKLITAIDEFGKQLARGKRQFNSLLELDNALVSYLQDRTQGPVGRR